MLLRYTCMAATILTLKVLVRNILYTVIQNSTGNIVNDIEITQRQCETYICVVFNESF